LARRAFEHLQITGESCSQTLDLCSGCGIVGLDFLFHLSQAQMHLPRHIDFVDVQNIYAPHFANNIVGMQNFIPSIPPYSFLNLNYNQMLTPDFKEKYDLILSNPPYFRKEHGLLSNSEFKNRCRFFIDSDFASLIKTIEHSLKPKGQAFVLMKSLSEHGINIEDEFHQITSTLMLQSMGLVRDTHLYRIKIKS
jgi:tRNA1Val (adenine37-N6)-methyltransferase